MSNIASYLSKREIGSNNKRWNTKDKIQDYFDEIGSKPVINKVRDGIQKIKFRITLMK